jgi:uncharacterized protein (DUF488 family)
MTVSDRRVILTVGHSNHPFQRLYELLAANDVTLVADVRSTPYSRRYPDYNRESLERALMQRRIGYLFLGNELGARPKDRSCYVSGRVQYRTLAQTALFRSGLEWLLAEAGSNRVALLCAEREPLACHRAILVARELVMLDVAVEHIHADGRIETHAEALERLLDDLNLRQFNLFGASDLIDQAYAEREASIAYSLSGATPTEDEGEEG